MESEDEQKSHMLLKRQEWKYEGKLLRESLCKMQVFSGSKIQRWHQEWQKMKHNTKLQCWWKKATAYVQVKRGKKLIGAIIYIR